MKEKRMNITVSETGLVPLNLAEFAGKEVELIIQPKKATPVTVSQSESVLRANVIKEVAHFCEQKYQAIDFIAGESPVPVSGKLIGNQEISNIVESALDGWLTTGRFNDAFEKKLAEFIGVKHVLTTNSGSSANLLAFLALTSHKLGERAIQKGDEVITVAAGFPTTVNPILQYGAIPVFVDIELATYNVNATLIEAAISSKTKAIMLAHTLGNPFNLIAVKSLCDQYGLWLIEDCCDALGSTFNGQHVGTFGDIATLSFYPAHHITTGEGGAIFTNNGKLKLIIESFRDWGRDCFCPPGKDNTCKKRFCFQQGELPEGYDHKYTYSHLGYNLKLTDMQAACGLAQMDSLSSFIKTRQHNFLYLQKGLESLQGFLILPEATEQAEASWFGFPITLLQHDRRELINFLEQKKIASRLLFGGNLIKQPYFNEQQYRVASLLENTDKVMNKTLWLGVYPALSEIMLDYIIKSLKEFFTELINSKNL